MSTENSQTTPKNTAVAKFGENTLENVKNKIMAFLETGEIKVAPNYAVENNIRFAWLLLQDQVDRSDKPVLEVCTSASVSNALLKMVVQGLNPAKHQCSFIAYGNKLTFQRQYQGAIVLAKRMSDVVDVKANAIYKEDKFTFEVNADTGIKKVLEHKQTLDSIDVDNVVGAYAILTMEDGSVQHEIMNIKQIRKSWEMGATKGTSPAHKNFPDEMACKTVINRACKLKIESSDDSDLFKDDEVDTMAATSDQVKETVKTKANKREMSFDEAEIVPDPPADDAPNTEIKKEESEPAVNNGSNPKEPQLKF